MVTCIIGSIPTLLQCVVLVRRTKSDVGWMQMVRKLSGLKIGFIQTMTLNEKLPDGCTWSGGEQKIQAIIQARLFVVRRSMKSFCSVLSERKQYWPLKQSKLDRLNGENLLCPFGQQQNAPEKFKVQVGSVMPCASQISEPTSTKEGEGPRSHPRKKATARSKLLGTLRTERPIGFSIQQEDTMRMRR